MIKSRLLASNLSRCRVRHEDSGGTRGPTRDACSLHFTVTCDPMQTAYNCMQGCIRLYACRLYTVVCRQAAGRLHTSLVGPRHKLTLTDNQVIYTGWAKKQTFKKQSGFLAHPVDSYRETCADRLSEIRIDSRTLHLHRIQPTNLHIVEQSIFTLLHGARSSFIRNYRL